MAIDGSFCAYRYIIITIHTKNTATIPDTDSINDLCALRFLTIFSSLLLILNNFKEITVYIIRKPKNTNMISVKITLKKKRNMFRGLKGLRSVSFRLAYCPLLIAN
jgi:hypothetical protein